MGQRSCRALSEEFNFLIWRLSMPCSAVTSNKVKKIVLKNECVVERGEHSKINISVKTKPQAMVEKRKKSVFKRWEFYVI